MTDINILPDFESPMLKQLKESFPTPTHEEFFSSLCRWFLDEMKTPVEKRSPIFVTDTINELKLRLDIWEGGNSYMHIQFELLRQNDIPDFWKPRLELYWKAVKRKAIDEGVWMPKMIPSLIEALKETEIKINKLLNKNVTPVVDVKKSSSSFDVIV